MRPLRDAMRREAGRVWREKERAEHLGFFMNEETITETLLLRLALEFRAKGLVVRPFTKAEETKNGADWEFWFIQHAKAVGLRVQAKRLFPSRRYDSLKLLGPQITNLINNAGNCFPVYVFYNDASAYSSSSPICACNEYRGPSYLGCTLAPAAAIILAASNTASSLQNVVTPWHCLLCDGATKKRTMPELVAYNLNKRVKALDATSCNAVPTPREFEEVIETPGSEFFEPQWLSRYLQEKKLAGIALIGFAPEET